MAVSVEPGFTIETIGEPDPFRPRIRYGFVTILVLGALVARPYVDPHRADFALYLQARSFAALRLDIPLPANAAIPADVVARDGRYYGNAAPGGPLLLVPFVWAGWLLDALTDGRLGTQEVAGWRVPNAEYAAVHAANLCFLAGILFFFTRLAVVLLPERSPPIILRGAELLFFAAPLWSLCSHPTTFLPATMFLLGATALVFEGRRLRAPWVEAGLLAAGAVFVRPTDVILVLVLLAYGVSVAVKPVNAGLRFLAPVIVSAALLLGANAALHGAALGTSYDGGSGGASDARFTTPLAEGLVGLTVGGISGRDATDPEDRRSMVVPDASTPWKRVRGLVWLMPVALFGIPGLLRLDRDDQRAEAAVIGGSLVLLLLLFARSSHWYGEVSMPLASRYLTEAMPAWCLATAAWAEEAKGWRRSFFIIATCWSAGNQLLVVLQPYSSVLSGIDVTAQHVWKIASLLLVTSVFAWVGEGMRSPDRDSRLPFG